MAFVSALIALWVGLLAAPALADSIQFGGKHYVRDLGANSARAVGDAWVKRGDREVRADKIEIDFVTNRATASGNVTIRDSKLQIWCSHADYNLQGEDAILEDARLVLDQTVVSGSTVHRIDRTNFEVFEGTYTNCNVELVKSPLVADCNFDWKLHGRRFRIEFGGYAHFYDVLLIAKNLPLLYAPYLMVPVKTERQSGLLRPSFLSSGNMGNGFSLPLYLALGEWHDLTLTPTLWSRYGMQYGTQYRYSYSPVTDGMLRTSFFSRRYGSINNPPVLDPAQPLTAGVIGEWSVNFQNRVGLWGRAHTRHVARVVSNPYYVVDFPGEIGPIADLGYLRSLISFTQPGDNFFFGAQAQYFQTLTASVTSVNNNGVQQPVPRGIDAGAVSQLPQLQFSRPLYPFWQPYLGFELDTQFTNFQRGQAFDRVPSNAKLSGPNATDPEDPNRTFTGNDYLRTGRRFIAEPRLIATVPISPGFQFQPVLAAGAIGYDLQHPTPEFLHREYLYMEVPFSLYLARTFTTPLPGLRHISHVFQPRVVYASSLYSSPDPNHPFFYRQQTPVQLANPRFDIRDTVTDFEYTRFELINRLRRKTDDGNVNRFFLLQISEQFNSRVSAVDPRYSRRLGPIEILAGLTLDQVSAQLQATHQLEETRTLNNSPLAEPVREYAYSGSIQVRWGERDSARMTSLLTQNADSALTEQLASFYVYKSLPTFFDIDANVEYSFRRARLVSYQVGLYFSAKPRACWRFAILSGRNAFNVNFFNFNFQLDFNSSGT